MIKRNFAKRLKRLEAHADAIRARAEADRTEQSGATLWEELLSKCGIKPLPGEWRPGLLADALGMTVLEMKDYLRPDKADWAERLWHAELAINSAVHASTGRSPFSLVHSREPNMPLDQALGPLRPGATPCPAAGGQYGWSKNGVSLAPAACWGRAGRPAPPFRPRCVGGSDGRLGSPG